MVVPISVARVAIRRDDRDADHTVSALRHDESPAARTPRRIRQVRQVRQAAVHRTSDRPHRSTVPAPCRRGRSAGVGRFLGRLVRPLPGDGAGVRRDRAALRAARAFREGRHRRAAGLGVPARHPGHPDHDPVPRRPRGRAPQRRHAGRRTVGVDRSASRGLIQRRSSWEIAMTYYFSRILPINHADAVKRATEALAAEGFGILTQIDVKDALKKKIGVDFRPYLILGACNPKLAHEALTIEDKIGTMLPCNVVVQETPDGKTEIAAIDPVASMAAVDNPRLKEAAMIVREKLKKAIAAL